MALAMMESKIAAGGVTKVEVGVTTEGSRCATRVWQKSS